MNEQINDTIPPVEEPTEKDLSGVLAELQFSLIFDDLNMKFNSIVELQSVPRFKNAKDKLIESAGVEKYYDVIEEMIYANRGMIKPFLHRYK